MLFLGPSPLVRASYRASASALVSMFTAMNTASRTVIHGRTRLRTFFMPLSTSG